MEILCKFTNFEAASKILEDRTIKLGNISKSNDPIEIKRISIINGIIDSEYNDKLNKLANEYLDSILKMTCFTYGVYDFYDDLEILEASSKEERPPFFKPRMWALYGGNKCDNSGICIVYNKDKIIKTFDQLDDNYICKYNKVTYKNFLNREMSGEFNFNTEINTIEGIHDSVQRYLEKNYQFNYFQKDIDWSEECEYRLLCWNKIDNTDYRDTTISFEKEDIEAVILGYNISKNNNYKNLVSNLLIQEVPIYKIGLFENVPILRPIMDYRDNDLDTIIFK